MRIACCVIFALGTTLAAHADFSYTVTVRNPVDTEASQPYRSAPGAGPAAQTTKHYLKGQRIKVDNGSTAAVIDLDAQTVTVIDNKQKTYAVTKFADLGQQSDLEAKIDVKETGQRRTINGYKASETVMTIDIDSPQAAGAGTKTQVEIDMWLSPDIPGSEEWRAFFQKNRDHFPWTAVSGGANSTMQQAMADLQRKMTSLQEVPVMEVIRARPAGNDAQLAQAHQGMEQGRAQLETMRQQSGPQAAAAENSPVRTEARTPGSGALFEITMESSGFSTGTIPDSVFGIPAGYGQK